MSKGEGRKIGIKFTEELTNVATTPPEGYPEIQASGGTASTSNQYSTSYSADKAFDGSTSSYWQTRATLPQWLQIQLTSPIALTRFRWYTTSYAPNNFELYGSQNGTDFELLYSGNNSSSSGWESFDIPNTKPFNYYRWNILSGYSSRIYLYEIEMFYKEFQNEGAFSITGQEHKYVNGPLIEKVYQIERLDLHPTEPRAILLTIDNFSRFTNIEGDLTITYDASNGTLAGAGGAVESFTQIFTPTDLVPEPNPGIQEYINAVPSIELEYLEVEYLNTYNTESISASPVSLTLEYVHIDDVNP